MAEEKQQTESSDLSAPTESIENCKTITDTLYNAKADAVVTAEEVWAITGPRGTMSPKISACVQYGLLENNSSGKGYRVSDFGVSVIRPEYTDAHYIKKKLLEAFNKPALYKKLIERYNSKGLPNQQGLTNILVTEFGFNKNSTGPKASSVFLENCNFLNLNDSGRLRFFMPTIINSEIESKGKINPSTKEIEESPTINDKTFRLPIDLGEKTAYLEYPKDISLDEIGELKIMVDAAISALELRKKRNKNPVE